MKKGAVMETVNTSLIEKLKNDDNVATIISSPLLINAYGQIEPIYIIDWKWANNAVVNACETAKLDTHSETPGKINRLLDWYYKLWNDKLNRISDIKHSEIIKNWIVEGGPHMRNITEILTSQRMRSRFDTRQIVSDFLGCNISYMWYKAILLVLMRYDGQNKTRMKFYVFYSNFIESKCSGK